MYDPSIFPVQDLTDPDWKVPLRHRAEATAVQTQGQLAFSRTVVIPNRMPATAHFIQNYSTVIL